MTFTDRNGRAWSLALTVGTVKRVQDLTGVNLGACTKETFAALAGEWVKLVDVVCAIIRPQLQSKGVSDEDFAEALGGDELQAATDALLAALVDFFPPKKRPVLQKAIDRMQELESQAVARATACLESLTLPDVLGDSGASSGSVPALSVAIPPGSRSTASYPRLMPESAASGTEQPG